MYFENSTITDDSSVMIKPLVWSTNRKPNEDCRYDHCIAETPFGRFVIGWRSWKIEYREDFSVVEHPLRKLGDTERNPYCFNTFWTLDEAKQAVQDEFERRILEALA
jgi:hypothetical protein